VGRWVDVGTDDGGNTAGADAASGRVRPPARRIPFLGEHTPRMDDKGRLFLPAAFRDALAEGVVLTRGQDRCLFVFPNDEFFRLYDEVMAEPLGDRRARADQRLFTSAAAAQVPDKQGRVTVTPNLREWAGLTKECVVIGAGTRLEVWDALRWDRYRSAKEAGYADEDDDGGFDDRDADGPDTTDGREVSVP
jgi:MraZ protein